MNSLFLIAAGIASFMNQCAEGISLCASDQTTLEKYEEDIHSQGYSLYHPAGCVDSQHPTPDTEEVVVDLEVSEDFHAERDGLYVNSVTGCVTGIPESASVPSNLREFLVEKLPITFTIHDLIAGNYAFSHVPGVHFRSGRPALVYYRKRET